VIRTWSTPIEIVKAIRDPKNFSISKALGAVATEALLGAATSGLSAARGVQKLGTLARLATETAIDAGASVAAAEVKAQFGEGSGADAGGVLAGTLGGRAGRTHCQPRHRQGGSRSGSSFL
jgi:hypothetical protein